NGLAQVAPAAVAEHVRGAQIGLGSVTLKDHEGLQLGAGNYAKEMNGAQLGVANIAGKVSGAQIGLFNHAESLRGIQIGLVNHAEDGGIVPWSVLLNMGFNSEPDGRRDVAIAK